MVPITGTMILQSFKDASARSIGAARTATSGTGSYEV
jgi:hypothetical protein